MNFQFLSGKWLTVESIGVLSFQGVFAVLGTLKAGSLGPFLINRFYSVPKIGQCEHIKGSLPTLGSVNLDKRLRKPIYSIFKT